MVSTLKRTAETIFDNGGFLRKIDNLGFRNLPFKCSEHGLVHRTGHAFVMKFDIPPPAVTHINQVTSKTLNL